MPSNLSEVGGSVAPLDGDDSILDVFGGARIATRTGLEIIYTSKQTERLTRFPTSSPRTVAMSDNPEANIATADAITLLLHKQHALGAAIEEVTKWLSENGGGASQPTQRRS